MNEKEALIRVKTGNFNDGHGFDMQLLVDAVGIIGEMFRRGQIIEIQESKWLEDSDPGQEYGTTWACQKCHHSIHKSFVWNPYASKMNYCPTCGARMAVKLE